MANFWIYRLRLGQETATLDAVAAGKWPVYTPADSRPTQVATQPEPPVETVAEVIPADAAMVDSINIETEAPLGEEASSRALQSTVGLVWRALLLWMLLVLLLSIAKWLG